MMRCLVGVGVLAFAIILRFSLAEILLNEEFLLKEAFSEDPNLFFNDGWQDTEGSTLGFQSNFNDVAPFAKLPDDDLMFASACDGGNGGFDGTGGSGGNDNLNKLRAREESSCTYNNEGNEGVSVPLIPQIFQSTESALEMLGAATKTKSPRCRIPPYVYNLCCDGWLGPESAEGPPRVFAWIDDCYLSMILTFLLLLPLLQLPLQYLSYTDWYG